MLLPQQVVLHMGKWVRYSRGDWRVLSAAAFTIKQIDGTCIKEVSTSS
jgi:hypothetical protein